VWERWRAWDPVNLADRPEVIENLRRMRAIHVDCGTSDEFALYWGARALVGKLRAAGIAVRHEEFDDGHFHVPYRYEVSLPFLAKAIMM
jgi:S-formylglutathione hydrolase FrmB